MSFVARKLRAISDAHQKRKDSRQRANAMAADMLSDTSDEEDRQEENVVWPGLTLDGAGPMEATLAVVQEEAVQARRERDEAVEVRRGAQRTAAILVQQQTKLHIENAALVQEVAALKERLAAAMAKLDEHDLAI